MEKKNAMLDLLKKKNTTNLDLADNIAASVHYATAPTLLAQSQIIDPKEEPTKRISLNTPITTYIEVKALSVKRGTTLMQYILDLIEEDIQKHKK